MRSILHRLNPDGVVSLTLVSLIGVVALVPLMILPMFVLAYRDLLGFTPDVAGWVASSSLAGITVMTLTVSLKAKTWKLTRVTALGMIAVLVFNGLMIFAHDAGTLAALCFLGGLGGGAAQASVAAVLARATHSEKAFGIYIFWQFALPAIGLFWFARLLFDESGIGGTLVGLDAMLGVLVVFDLFALLVVSVISNYPLAKSEVESNVMELSLILKPAALLSLTGLMIYGAANAAVWAYAEGIGLRAKDDVVWVGDTLALITGISVLGPLLVTILRDRFGHYAPLAIGVALQIASMWVLITVVTPAGYIAGIGMFSLAWAFSWPYFLSIQASFDKTGSVVSCGQFTNLIGNTAGPFMAAFLVGAEGNYAGAIWLAGALFILALVPMFFIRACPE